MLMRIKDLNNRAFSLLEILLSAVIFMISVAGVFITLNAVRGPVANKENALTGAVFSKQVLQALYSKVDAGTWNSNCNNNPCSAFDLSEGTHQVPLPVNGLNWPSTAFSNANKVNGNPVLTYVVTCADGSGSHDGTGTIPCNFYSARRVDLKLNWPSV